MAFIKENQLNNEEIELSESEEVVKPDMKDVKSKNTSQDTYNELETMINNIDTNYTAFIEKEKAYEKERKEYNMTVKKEHKELLVIFKKFTKNYQNDMLKLNKPRKTNNCGKGGFNKLVPVPPKLIKYLELEDGAMLTRPAITRVLNDKFKLDNFRNGKDIKITSRKAAKILGCKYNITISFSNFQGFIKKFYDEVKDNINEDVTEYASDDSSDEEAEPDDEAPCEEVAPVDDETHLSSSKKSTSKKSSSKKSTSKKSSSKKSSSKKSTSES